MKGKSTTTVFDEGWKDLLHEAKRLMKYNELTKEKEEEEERDTEKVGRGLWGRGRKRLVVGEDDEKWGLLKAGRG